MLRNAIISKNKNLVASLKAIDIPLKILQILEHRNFIDNSVEATIQALFDTNLFL